MMKTRSNFAAKPRVLPPVVICANAARSVRSSTRTGEHAVSPDRVAPFLRKDQEQPERVHVQQ
jgi:hypothetical protein